MSEKVQFQTNVPIDIALKYNDGKEVTGQYGDQVLYTLTDGRIMYVPPIVKRKIDELGIVHDHEGGEGERNTAHYRVGGCDRRKWRSNTSKARSEAEQHTAAPAPQETVHDFAVAECLEFFRKILGQELEEATLQKGEHPMELLELGETMVTKYVEDAAPLIQPAAVQSRVSGVIGGVKVSGYVDLLDIEGRIIDSKSALRPFKGVSHDHRLQL